MSNTADMLSHEPAVKERDNRSATIEDRGDIPGSTAATGAGLAEADDHADDDGVCVSCLGVRSW